MNIKENKPLIGVVNPIKLDFSNCLDCKLLAICSKKTSITEIKRTCIKNICPISEKKVEDATNLIEDGLIKNLTPDWYRNAIMQHTFGVSTPTLKVSHVVLSCHFDDPSYLSEVENEIGRVPISTSSDSGSTGTSEVLFGLSDAITGNYTITAVASKKLFSLNSIIGLHVGDLIKVKLSSYSNQEIEAKVKTLPGAGTQIEITTELPVLPVVGDNVYQYLGRIYLVANGTSTPGSGKPVSIALYRDRKLNTDTLSIRHSLTMLG